ncbi:MAG: prepilin-type N-terminal cleavage/methylation domain-containing protein [Candidatus Omnitrophica bacterium]|nr:prepilin-type N-terminal cleavage/methylation domain-containing protein [Candidatus Omnitrophota bacterium]
MVRLKAVKGFTLIELLIVIAIILILIAIALPNFLEAQERAKVTRAKGELRSITTAAHEHLLTYNYFYSDYNDQVELRVTTRNNFNGSMDTPCPTDPPEPTETGGLEFLGSQKGNYGPGIHCPLTTPIQFIDAGSFHDPWSDGTIPIGYDSRRSSTTGDDPKILYYGAYFVSGPDHIAGHWNRGYPGNTTGMALAYAPTNGTRSLGEIWSVVALDTRRARTEYDPLTSQ